MIPARARDSRPTAIDIFAGCGGLSLGFEQAGFDVLAAVELDRINADTYRYNFPFTHVLQADASTLDVTTIIDAARLGHNLHGRTGRFRRRVDVVFGGPPCQGFSIGGSRNPDDPRNELVFHFARLVVALKPRYFVMENVPGLLSADNRITVLRLLRSFRAAGYAVATPIKKIDAVDFGVPQDRRRSILLGWMDDESPLSYPLPTHRRTDAGAESELALGPSVQDAIADLCDTDDPSFDLAAARRAGSNYLRRLRGRDPDDFSYPRILSSTIMTGMELTVHSRKSIRRFETTKPGGTDKISRFRRLSLTGVSSTLRAGTGPDHGSHTPPRPIHPILPRVITVREAARLHSFPDWFGFHSTKWHAWRQIGNSVPPLLGRAVAREIVRAAALSVVAPERRVKLIQACGGASDLNAEVRRTKDSDRRTLDTRRSVLS